MALETLNDLSAIGGYQIIRTNSIWNQPKGNFIEINDKDNAITFKIQKGPIKESGKNGCQVDTVIEAANLMLKRLNHKYSCRENDIAIEKLDEAIMWLKKRTEDREARGVEGTSLQ